MFERDMPYLGIHVPQAVFEQRIMADPEVLGTLYCGSRGRGQADRYSDLDITIWLRDEALAKPGRMVVERFLSEDELALLYAAWPQALEREAIRRAARGLLEWIRYVWTQVEQTLGEELGIALDTATFLAAIECPHTWDQAAAHER